MKINIRPYTETPHDLPTEPTPGATSDSRTDAFMDALRARVSLDDEKRRQKQAKPAKAAHRKAATPSRPEWLNAPTKPAKTSSPATPEAPSWPFGAPKKRRSG